MKKWYWDWRRWVGWWMGDWSEQWKIRIDIWCRGRSESDVLFHRPTLVSSSGDIDRGTTTEFFLATRPLAAKKIHLPTLGAETKPLPSPHLIQRRHGARQQTRTRWQDRSFRKRCRRRNGERRRDIRHWRSTLCHDFFFSCEWKQPWVLEAAYV